MRKYYTQQLNCFIIINYAGNNILILFSASRYKNLNVSKVKGKLNLMFIKSNFFRGCEGFYFYRMGRFSKSVS